VQGEFLLGGRPGGARWQTRTPDIATLYGNQNLGIRTGLSLAAYANRGMFGVTGWAEAGRYDIPSVPGVGVDTALERGDRHRREGRARVNGSRII
jgi:hypothetical protein